jgi:fluoroquinolone resistance protein
MLQNHTNYFEQTFENIEGNELRLEDAEFEQCTFKACTFQTAHFSKCRFLNCTFTRCNLSLITCDQSSILDTNFEECKITGVNWLSLSDRLGISFTFKKCLLDYDIFTGLKLKKIKIQDCSCHSVDFAECDLSESVLTGTDLTDATFLHTNLIKSDLRGALGYNISVFDNKLSKAQFSFPEVMNLLKNLNIEIEGFEV